MTPSEITSILVTGSTGFVGRHVVQQIRAELPHVKLYLARRQSVDAGVSSDGNVDVVKWDFVEPLFLNRSVDVVIHAGGEKKDLRRMQQVNVDGTGNLLNWSVRNGVRRFVHLSSAGVYGARSHRGIVNEESSRYPANPYESSKYASEELVKSVCARSGMSYLIIQPTNVIGWVGNGVNPLLGLFSSVKRGLFCYFSASEIVFNYVSVEDVACALTRSVLVAESGRSFIVNSPTNGAEFINCIADALGAPAPSRRVPYPIGFGGAVFADAVNLVRPGALPFGRERLRELTNAMRYDGSQIVAAIGQIYRLGIDASVRNLIDAYTKHGLLK